MLFAHFSQLFIKINKKNIVYVPAKAYRKWKGIFYENKQGKLFKMSAN